MADQTTLISQFYVAVEGMDDSTGVDLMTDILEVTVESSLHLPDVATVVLHDTHLRWVDDARIEPGKGVKISAKAEQGEQPLFDGEIIELEPEFSSAANRLVIRAFDRLHRLARGRYVRSFVNVTDGDLANKIAQEQGLQADIGPTSQVHPYVLQNNQSNLEFLQARAKSLGYLVFVDGKTLHVLPPKADGGTIELKWAETLHEFHPRMTTVGQITASTVRGWDPATRQAIVGQASNGNGTPQVGEQRRPGALAHQAFNLEAPLLTADRPIRSQGEADRLAQAMADRQASRFIEADGSCGGNAKIVAGASVHVTAVGDRFSGTYLVTSAQHTYNGHDGYTTRFSISGQNPVTILSLLEPDPTRGPMAGLAIGIVTDNQDPDNQGRVKVKYPWLSPDHASDWARVVVPGGGDQRGIEFLPEINDEVLVGFELGDVHHPYILGGLWNGQDKPPADGAVSGSKVQKRVIKSRTGHIVTLDDTDGGGGITIADRSGNQIQLDTGSNALKIKTQGDVTIEAQGNFSVKAQGQVEIDGLGVNVNGGAGTVDVKGSLINLN
jgi:phage protein D